MVFLFELLQESKIAFIIDLYKWGKIFSFNIIIWELKNSIKKHFYGL